MRKARTTGADIIEAIIENLHAHMEPIYYTAQAPELYHVYLHESDFARLKPLFPQIVEEAKHALGDEIRRLNRRGVVSSLRERLQKRLPSNVQNRIAGKPSLVYLTPKRGWRIVFHDDCDRELSQGEIAVLSELLAPSDAEYSRDNPTSTITTIKRIRPSSASKEADSITIRRPQVRKPAIAKQPAPVNPDPQTLIPQQAAWAHSSKPTLDAPQTRVYAVIRYRDNSGEQVFQMTKSSITIGRGGKDRSVDLKLKTDARVSREHLRLRFDAETDRFYIKDLSAYGITVNGSNISETLSQSSLTTDNETLLPARARIVLADVVTLEFEATEHSLTAFVIS